MGGGRVTQLMFIDRTLQDLQRQFNQVFKYEQQLATGFRVNRPSDDPIDARRAVNIKLEIAQLNQFLSNITDARPQLDDTETALSNMTNVLQRARELTVQGANGTNSQEQLDAIATEIDQLLEETLVLSNSQSIGRYLFSGTRTKTAAFSETRVGGEITSVTYQGNTEAINVAISESAQIKVNVDGQSAFQGGVDIFATLIGIRDDLRAGDQASLSGIRIDEVDQAIEQVLLRQADLGANTNRLDRVVSVTEDGVVSQQVLLSEKIETDFADATLRYNNSLNALQAALNASARILQPTLLDFIR